jgi:hypothetical protein
MDRNRSPEVGQGPWSLRHLGGQESPRRDSQAEARLPSKREITKDGKVTMIQQLVDRSRQGTRKKRLNEVLLATHLGQRGRPIAI